MLRRLGVVLLAAVALGAGTAQPLDATHARARAIIAAAQASPRAWDRLRVLTDTIGHRLAGTEAEARAVAWGKQEFEQDGIPVHLEKVMVHVWVRGQESASIVAPFVRPLAMLGLGNSVGTPEAGIEAPVVVVADEAALKLLPDESVAGKIVLFDHPFVRTGDEMKDYGAAVKYRAEGASIAAKRGAEAVLVRSVATTSLRTPHTGALGYDPAVPRQIPAAAVSIEDAMLLHRLSDAGAQPVVRLVMGARTEPDHEGANVVAEIRGRETPEQVVLVGAHLDSWDVGQGAIDDGAGCAIVLETMRLIGTGQRPRRTVRAVLFANEENGGGGGKGYRDAHKAELANHVALVETDSGGGRPLGFSVSGGEGAEAMLRLLLEPVLVPLGAERIRSGGGGADIGPMGELGVVQVGFEPDTTRYFDWHHTEADTLDKIDPQELQDSAAALAAAVWVLADAPQTLPRPAPNPPTTTP